MRRWAKRLLLLAAVLVLALAAPVAWIETACLHDGAPVANDYVPILPVEHRRNEIDTFLTYPEWAIVHAYEDFAAVVRARSETGFAYFSSIGGFWKNLCAMTRHASARGTITADVRAMLHIIGVSFSAEMTVKGLYENTLGRMTEVLRGNQRTPEDEFALAVAEDYAKFLRQTPWYEYPFASTLQRFWSEVPWSRGSYARKVERRIGLSLEWGVKSVYAKLIGALAGLAPAKTRIRSVVRGLHELDLVRDTRITLIQHREDWTSIIETPRYREFTEILAAFAARERAIVEIAGNDDVFITVLVPPAVKPALGEPLIVVPLQARYGWQRQGFALKVSGLTAAIRALGTAQLEHVYDY